MAVTTADGSSKKSKQSLAGNIFWKLGPGLITGAADDDPSGIATYSQVGAQFGYGMLWTMLFSFPLMAAIQEISARIGRVSGIGIAGNIRRHYSKPYMYGIVRRPGPLYARLPTRAELGDRIRLGADDLTRVIDNVLLEGRLRHAGQSSLQTVAEEILGLSKMNWNTFDLYTKLPATIQSSGEIARVGALLERFGQNSYDYRLFI